jgi:hypothetical protein
MQVGAKISSIAIAWIGCFGLAQSLERCSMVMTIVTSKTCAVVKAA